VETVAARDVNEAELDRLDAAVASMGRESMLAAALNHLACNVRAGSDIMIAASDDHFTPAAAAKLLGMSRTHLYKVMDAGDLPFRRVGRDRRIVTSDLLSFFRKRESERGRLAERFAHAEKDRDALLRELAG
jgi:excisionase family DNA binding protein